MSQNLRDNAGKAIESLRLPGVVLPLFDGEQVHPALSCRAQSPFHSVTLGAGLDPAFVPFWECGTMVSGYSATRGKYEKVSLQDPAGPSFTGASFRALFCDLLIYLWEDENDDATLQDVVSLFDMPPINLLLRNLAAQPSYSPDWDRWRADVVHQYALGE